MSSSVSPSAGGVLVVTHVYPPNSQYQGQQVCEGAQTFSRACPLAVGTVQIIIGVMVFLFGVVVVATQQLSLGVLGGFFVWGAAFYITAGSLTVAAGKSFNRCLVNTTLGFNVVASVASFTAIILYTLDAALLPLCYDCPYWNQARGFSGVLAVFHLLEFIVSITVSAFACKATCNCGREQPFYIIPGNASMAPQAVPTFQAASASVTPPPPQQQPFYIIPGNASMAPQAVPTFQAASASVIPPPPQMVNLHKEELTVPEPPAYGDN
ncbi:membrane-spanning 4-domains subfamily A member 15-like isoform X3 [Labrus mixtus]|uniref:membrane-spanning 4-domains subfamily A member 15-like isoform X3 n=1 Tax=Labrus mixtus TaxID=508554 RepID=UPI0029C07BD2|nr:membrane-spanning 4-domains subfamily A member 15-like isoform X3 [Labrus mixtus]